MQHTLETPNSFQLFLSKAWAFIKRDALESFSYKISAILNLGAVIAQIITFFFIAKLVDAGNALNMDYFPFVLIGIALAGFQSTGLNSFAQALQKEQGAGTLEAILITPTSLTTVMFIGSLWHLFVTTTKVALYLLVGAFLFGVDLSMMNTGSFLLTLAFSILSLSGIGIFAAGFILAYKQNSPLQFLLNGFSRLLSGVYFPVTLLPLWIQDGAHFLPLTHSLSAARKALFENASLTHISAELTALLIFTLIFLPVGILFFQWGLRKAKQDGSLTHY